MVIRCLVCRVTWKKESIRSFHRFPRDTRRDEWLKSLHLTEDDIRYLKGVVICSDHFTSEELYTGIEGKLCIKYKAIPKLSTQEESISSQLSQPNSVKKQLTSTIQQSSDPRNVISSYASCDSGDSRKSANTALEIIFNEPHDFPCPKAKIKWQNCKKTVQKQKKKISSLQDQFKSLKMGVNSLTSLLNHLRQKR